MLFALFICKCERKSCAKFIQGIGGGFEHKSITRFQLRTARTAIAAFAIADKTDQSDIRLFGVFFDLRQTLADDFAVCGHGQLGDIIRHVIACGTVIAPRGDQSPANQSDESKTRNRGDASHGGEVEHLEGLAKLLFADGRNDDVWRSANQRDHATKDRRKTQRHQ